MKFYYNKKLEKLIIKESTQTEYNYLKNYLYKRIENYKYHPKVVQGIWDGRVNNFNNGYIDLGLWKRCYEVCRLARTKFVILNKQDFPLNRNITKEEFVKFIDWFFEGRTIGDKKEKFYPYEHQIEAAYKILVNRYCRIEVATSGGKSLIYSLVIFFLMHKYGNDKKFLLIVPSISLVGQFYDDLVDYNEGFHKEAINKTELRMYEIMSDKPRRYNGEGEPNIVISTFQSLANDEVFKQEFFDQFFCVTADEAHRVKSVTLKKSMEKTKGIAKYRFGMSGTYPKDETTDILDIESVTGPGVIKVRADHLMKKDLVSGLIIKTICLNHNDIPFAHKIKTIKKHNPRKALELEKKYIQDSDGRIDFICKNIIGNIDKNALLLFHNIDHGVKLKEYAEFLYPDMEIHYIDGGVKNKDREEIKTRMKIHEKGKPKLLIATYGTLSTGVSVNALFYLIFADSFKSDVVIRQSIGRGLRKHKDKDKVMVFDITDIFDLKSKTGMLFNHSKARKNIYDEQNYEYTEKTINL